MEKNIDGRSRNDNSKEWREKRAKATEQLLRKALAFIHNADKNFSYKNVCNIMDKPATNEDRLIKAVITPTAISKSAHWKSLIQQHQLHSDSQKLKQKTSQFSTGDMAFELHKCKTLLAQKSDQVRQLEAIIKKEQIDVNRTFLNVTVNESFDYKNLLKSAYIAMINDGFVMLDNGNLVLEMSPSNILATKELLADLGLI